MKTTLEDMLDQEGIDPFFFRLFPSGIKEDLLLAGIGKASLCFYIFDQPAPSIKKWGIWGKEYNAIYVSMGITLLKADIVNPQNMQKGPIDIHYLGADFFGKRRFSFHSKGNDWDVYLAVQLTLQRPEMGHTTYLE